jgi:formate dehydrogenase maturation protein FdhE
MNSPESAGNEWVNLAPELRQKVLPQAEDVLDWVREFLAEGPLADEKNRPRIEAAIAFLESGSDEYREMSHQGLYIKLICIGYNERGQAALPLEKMSRYFEYLEFVNRVAFIEEKISQDSPDREQIRRAMYEAGERAVVLTNRYGDDTMRYALLELAAHLKDRELIDQDWTILD